VDESKLRQKIREAIIARALPLRRPERVWGGSGSGAECVLCGNPVTAEQTELELEFTGDSGRAATSCTVHAQCFSVWEVERESASGKVLPSTDDHGTMPGRERDRTRTSGTG
jgi:hypothetical protein